MHIATQQPTPLPPILAATAPPRRGRLVRQDSFWIKNKQTPLENSSSGSSDDSDDCTCPGDDYLSRFEKKLLQQMNSLSNEQRDSAARRRRVKKKTRESRLCPTGQGTNNDLNGQGAVAPRVNNNNKMLQPRRAMGNEDGVPPPAAGLVRSHNLNASPTTPSTTTTGMKISPPTSPSSGPCRRRRRRGLVVAGNTGTATNKDTKTAVAPIKKSSMKTAPPLVKRPRRRILDLTDFQATLRRAEYWKGHHLSAQMRVSHLERQKEQLERRLEHFETAVMDRLAHVIEQCGSSGGGAD